MTEDLDEVRPWWVFEAPEAVCMVPANSEAQARAILIANCYPATKVYPAAAVMEWPLICTRVTSRRALVTQLLGKPHFAGPTVVDLPDRRVEQEPKR